MPDAAIHIQPDDPQRPPVRQLLREHMAEMHRTSPPESIHALDVRELLAPDVSFWTACIDNQLAGCGALLHLNPQHAEIKSMRTSDAFRRRGIARRLLQFLITTARERGYTQLSLETGAQDAFEPARQLYARHGFTPCGPFANYQPDPNSVFMTLHLTG